MSVNNREERLQQINQMLLELASGNLFYRLERSSENDCLEALVLVLNMLAEELQESFLYQGYANNKGTTKFLVQMSFILDSKGIIQMVNQKTCSLLSLPHSHILGKPFYSLLTNASKSKWQKFWEKLVQKGFYDTSLELEFKTSKLLLPSCGYITSFKCENKKESNVLITVVVHSTEQNELEKGLKKTVAKTNRKTKNRDTKINYNDLRKIQEGHNLIVNNLDRDFPSLKEFASQLGLNEFKLKYGFKKLYGTSVYRYIAQERLRRANVLVQYTNLPVKTISHMFGFKSISHFSRTYKKRYGFAPKILRKLSLK